MSRRKDNETDNEAPEVIEPAKAPMRWVTQTLDSEGHSTIDRRLQMLVDGEYVDVPTEYV